MSIGREISCWKIEKTDVFQDGLCWKIRKKVGISVKFSCAIVIIENLKKAKEEI